MSETQHVFRKVALHFGWQRVALLCDKTDAYSTSFFDVINGTDPTNPRNLQQSLESGGIGGYDARRLSIVHAARIDLSENTNSTKEAMVDAIKATDAKVIMIFGSTAFIESIIFFGRDRELFGPGYQFMIADAVFPDKMNPKCRDAMDGAVQILAASTAPEYSGLQRAARFWKRHPPTHAPAGADTTTPFMVSGQKTRFSDASLYDSIMLAAVGLDACLKDGCRAVGHGYEKVMPYFRAVSIDGVAGPTSIKVGSNDPQGRLFAVKVGKNPASRGIGVTGPYTFTSVTVTSTKTPDVRVCVDRQLGKSCSDHAAPPRQVTCFASSHSINVEWEAAPQSKRGLLYGYRVAAFALGEQVVATVNSSAKTRVTFSTESANPQMRLKHNLVYSVQVEALYDNATIKSMGAVCQTPQDGLPCIPPIITPTRAGNRTSAGIRHNEQSPVCGCKSSEFHTKGMPSPTTGNVSSFMCEACLQGTQCNGGPAATMRVLPGFFVSRRVSAHTGREQRPFLWRCPGGMHACSGGAFITKAMGVPAAKISARACEDTNMTNYTEGERSLQQNSQQCQCGPGCTGLLCRACQSRPHDDMNGKDWVQTLTFTTSAGKFGCRECSMSSSEATTMVAVATLVCFLLVICAVLAWWWYTRPSITERRFVSAFLPIFELGAERAMEEFFGVAVGSSRSKKDRMLGLGITKDVFVKTVIRRCGRAKDLMKTRIGDSRVSDATTMRVKHDALKLWQKVDADGDGQVRLWAYVVVFDKLSVLKGECFASMVGSYEKLTCFFLDA